MSSVAEGNVVGVRGAKYPVGGCEACEFALCILVSDPAV